jgi:hypothetical protein
MGVGGSVGPQLRWPAICRDRGTHSCSYHCELIFKAFVCLFSDSRPRLETILPRRISGRSSSLLSGTSRFHDVRRSSQ